MLTSHLIFNNRKSFYCWLWNSEQVNINWVYSYLILHRGVFWIESSIYDGQKVSVFGVILVHIQSECWEMLTRITPNADTFYAVYDRAFLWNVWGVPEIVVRRFSVKKLFLKISQNSQLNWNLRNFYEHLFS